MKYTVGTIVVLNDERTVYITECDKLEKIYRGFDAEEDDPQEIIVFSDQDVLMKV